MDMTEVKVGDEVIICERGTRTLHTCKGKVTRAGRKLFDVEYYPWGEDRSSETRTFRIESGKSNDAYGHYWVETPEHAAETKRRAAALTTLHRAGLAVERASHQDGALSLGLLEALAAVVETWGQEGTDG
jgi:hypothetical protein